MRFLGDPRGYRHARDRDDDRHHPVILVYAFFSETLIQGMTASVLESPRPTWGEAMSGHHVGRRVEELDTPALLVDLAKFERNVATMRRVIVTEAGVRWRPHTKGIKVPALARKLLDAGARRRRVREAGRGRGHGRPPASRTS